MAEVVGVIGACASPVALRASPCAGSADRHAPSRLAKTRVSRELDNSAAGPSVRPSSSRRRSHSHRSRTAKQLTRCSAESDNGVSSSSDASGSSAQQPTSRVQTLEPQLSTETTDIEPIANYDLARSDVDDTTPLQSFLFPDKEELPDDVEMSIWDHLEELRERVLVSVAFVGAAILGCFAFAKDLVLILEAPVTSQGVRFLQLSPGEYFFVTLKVAGYSGLLVGSPVILYEIIAFVLPGLTRNERKFLAPIVLGSSILFYAGIAFSYIVLTPAALNFFVNYGEGVVESIWSIDQYFEFVLVLMLSTGLAFQVPVIQLLLGGTGLVTSEQMLSAWKYVVVGATIAAAVLTPSTDPLTQLLLAGPLIGLYIGGAYAVKAVEKRSA